MSVDEFIRSYRSQSLEHLRLGQAAFHQLTKTRPDLAKAVVAMPDTDPFYVDANLPTFEAWLRERWNES